MKIERAIRDLVAAARETCGDSDSAGDIHLIVVDHAVLKALESELRSGPLWSNARVSGPESNVCQLVIDGRPVTVASTHEVVRRGLAKPVAG